MPHITENGNPLEGHRPDKANPGEWETLSPEGEWGPATETHTLSLIATVGGGAGSVGGTVEGDFTFLLQSVDLNRPVIRNAPNGDLIAVNPAEILEDPTAFTVIAKAKNGIAPLIRLDGNGNLIAIPDPSIPKQFVTIVPASSAPVPTSGDVKRLAHISLPSGQFVTFIAVGGKIQSFVSEGSPQDTAAPTITGTNKFEDGTTRVFFSDGSFRDVPPEKPLPTGFDSFGEAEVAGKRAGITNPDIWVDTRGLFHFNIPADPAPTGTKVVSENVVGDETIYELENGQVIRQKTPVAPEPIARPEEVTIGDQPFAFNPNTGGFQQVQQPAREFDPDIVTIDGRAFIQQPDGSLTPLGREEVPNLDELINARLLAGDAPGALALADFRDRPTSLEAFNAAMQFAQSPGDVAAISAISRGQSLVPPPASGTVQRIAEQPEFLQDAFQRLINQFRGGSGSPEEFIDVLTRINKESSDRQTALEGKEKELVGVKETNRQLKLAAALDPLNQTLKDILQQKDFEATQARRDSPSTISNAAFSLLSPEMQAAFTGTRVSQVSTSPAFFGIDRGTTDDGGDPPAPDAPSAPAEALEDFSGVTTSAESEAAGGGFSESVGGFGGFDEDDFFAQGGVFDDNTAIVGEDGPELAIFPVGTRIVPTKDLTPAQLKALKKMGVRGMQTGGSITGVFTEEDRIAEERLRVGQGGGIADPLLPFGVRRALSGVVIEPTRRRLSRAAGLPVLSAQARQNLLPEELEVFNRLSREAGIPEGAFRQEQESAFPGVSLARGRARFAPRVLR